MLADPDDRPDADVVIYDGKCNFCIGQVTRLSKFDRRGRLSFISLHDARVVSRFSDLTYDQMMEQMWVVNDQGLRRGGADAVRYLTRSLPLLWPLAPLMHIPGSGRLWRWMYHQVAKRRYQLAGKNCDGDSCKIHLSP